jgi:subtilisin family serine protease
MRYRPAAVLTAVIALTAALTVQAHAQPTGSEDAREYVVVYRDGVSATEARAAVAASGGIVVNENAGVGVATVVTTNADFAEQAAGQAALDGVARNVRIGSLGPGDRRPKPGDVERLSDARAAGLGAGSRDAPELPGVEPLGGLQWDMQLIHATADGSHREQAGDRKVLVGIIDTGIDGSHPDIAPNFDREKSRNFTRDIPEVDGPCEAEPDASCDDPADVDENEHGTHVAGTVAAAVNGLGIAGVAPNVTLVNLRAGQDSGYFFLQPSVDALTYAADHGIDVVNMSYFIDPWLYNCRDLPGDSPEEQLEQRTIIRATQRALDYAHERGVTLIAAAGNEHTDLGHPIVDFVSPDFPPGSARERPVNNDCLTLPTEGRHVVGVTSVGPSTRKAYYSNYGVEQADVSAPGGDFRDYLGTEQYQSVDNLILSAYPRSIAVARGELDALGNPLTPFVVRNCREGVCAYYQYLQGTSMATPHAVGVAALIVSEFGRRDGDRRGLTLEPELTVQVLEDTATDHPCPEPRRFVYPDPDLTPDHTAVCEGPARNNGFYGHGLVDALNAVTAHRPPERDRDDDRRRGDRDDGNDDDRR